MRLSRGLVPRGLATAAASALLITGGLTGCSPLGGGSGDSGGSGADAAAGGAPGYDRNAEPVTKATFDSPAAPGGKVDIAIMNLKVRGRLATLNTEFTPRLPSGPDSTTPYRLNGRQGLDVSLIDPVNLKRYVVVKDSRGRELATDDVTTHIRNNERGHVHFTFAAPPEDVKALDVQIGAWPAFRDIPVER